MSDENYLYTGTGAIIILFIIGLVAVTPPSYNNFNETEIEIRLSDSLSSENFTASADKEKLFSEKGTTIKFSSLTNNPYFSEQNFECKISCKR